MNASLGGTIRRNWSKYHPSLFVLRSRPLQHQQVRNLPWVPSAYRRGAGRSAPTTATTARSRSPTKASRPSPRSRTPPSSSPSPARRRRGAWTHRASGAKTTTGPFDHPGSLSAAIQTNKESLLELREELERAIRDYRLVLGSELAVRVGAPREDSPLDGTGVSSSTLQLTSELRALHMDGSPRPDSWQYVKDTEPGFRRVGQLVGDMINLSCKIQNLVLRDVAQQRQQGDKQEEHVLYFYSNLAEQLLLALIEMQSARLALVESAKSDQQKASNSNKSIASGILGWLKDHVFDLTKETVPVNENPWNSEPPVLAHEDPVCSPRLEHFQGVADVVLSTLRQELQDPKQSPFRKVKRAQRLQQLLEKAPPTLKLDFITVRTLLQAYTLIGSYETARSCEKVANNYPELGEELFGWVLHAYSVAARSSSRNQERSKAAMRADELVRQRWMGEVGTLEHEEKKFLHCTKAILCLHAVGEEAAPDICKRADELANLCLPRDSLEEVFRNGNLEGLWKIAPSHLTVPLLNCLVLVYASSRDSYRVNLAKRLLQILLEDSDCKENADMPFPDLRTCKAVLTGLVGINDRRIRYTRVPLSDGAEKGKGNTNPKQLKDSSRENLEYGMQLLDHMFARSQCWPDQYYFHSLFRLLLMARPKETGNTADLLLSKMHIRECFGQCGPMVTTETYEYVLKAWLASAQNGDANAAKRSLELVKMMEFQSLPLCVLPDQVDSFGSPIYKTSVTPNRSTYELLLKICSSVEVPSEKNEALDIAMKVEQMMKKRGMASTSATYNLLFACCRRLLRDNPRRREVLMQIILEDARQQGNVNVDGLEKARGTVGEKENGQTDSKDVAGGKSSNGAGGAGLLSDLN